MTAGRTSTRRRDTNGGFSLTEMAQLIGEAAGVSLDSESPVMAVGVDDAVRRMCAFDRFHDSQKG